MDQHIGIIEHRFAGDRIGDEVRAEIALVELHAFEKLDGGVEALALFDGDDAVFADLVHRIGDHLADLLVLVGGTGADLGDFLGAFDLLAHDLELGDDGLDGEIDAALNLRGIRAGGNVAHALGEDSLGIDGGGGGTVAGNAAGFGSDFLDHLRAHVFVRVFELDFLGDGDAVFGDGRRAEGFFENDISTGRAEGDLDRAGQFAHAAEDRLAGLLVEQNALCCHWNFLLIVLLAGVWISKKNPAERGANG